VDFVYKKWVLLNSGLSHKVIMHYSLVLHMKMKACVVAPSLGTNLEGI
jgi:hypothetical protein